MITGDPYQFSIFANVVKEWNADESSFRNGVLLFCIDGKLFPNEVSTATLNGEIYHLKEKLCNLTVNEEFYSLEKEKAFIEMYNITFPDPEGDKENDYRYDISPLSFSDYHYYVFAVSNGEKTRIMAAKLNYVTEDSIHDLNDIDISETFIANDALNTIILGLEALI